ncbi:hypothetical protein ATN84_01755 [Paramesorhizobium deserti]|uniref:Uncharacterized protein n=1 Tax=Paramesorhizobium deserti TaxID=1494590 RepID=A0A135HZF3_9HYPH|nr:hypothetical protein [Paramesorhizobium deserti]KXF78543.1 hypothetical protein ATN84_01755 [Paramesorhizobium deserti]
MSTAMSEIDQLIADGDEPAWAIAAVSAARWAQQLLDDEAAKLDAVGASGNDVEAALDAKWQEIDTWLTDSLDTIAAAARHALAYADSRIALIAARLDALEASHGTQAAP